jgi:hypothetical protein
MLNSSLKQLEVSLEGRQGRLYGSSFEEEFKQNTGIQTLKLHHRRDSDDSWDEFTSPAIRRQLLLTQKFSSNIAEEVDTLGVWPHLLEIANREKPIFVFKLVQDLSQVWQWKNKRSQKRAHPATSAGEAADALSLSQSEAFAVGETKSR